MRKKLKLPRQTIRQLTPLPQSELNQVNGGRLDSYMQGGGQWCSTQLDSRCCTEISGCH